MSNGDGDWSNLLWEGLKYFLAGLGTVASSFAVWIGTRYRGDRAMLLRHDQALIANDKEIGLQHAFREKVSKGPVGEQITEEIKELQEADQRLNRRINKNHRMIARIDKRQAAIANDISWIKRHMEEDSKE